ncbi:hypothetical protein ABW21_db0205763 [Orbilia brochopaga]|nr:hypothetical protein ABW21_db0205763 [Drechslerella brochopaga]
MPTKRGNDRPKGSGQPAPAAMKRRRVPEPSGPSDAPGAKRARTGTDHADAEPSGGPADTSLQVGMHTRSMSRRVAAAIQGPREPNPPATHPTVFPANNQGQSLNPETQQRSWDPVLDKPRVRRPQQANPELRAGLYGTYRDRRGTKLRGYRLKPVNLDPSVPSWRGIVQAGFVVRHTAGSSEAVPAGGSSKRDEPKPSVATVSEQSRPTGTRGVRNPATIGGKTHGKGSSGDVTTGIAGPSTAVQHGLDIPGSLSPPVAPVASSRLRKRKIGADFGEQDAPPAKRRQQKQHTATGKATDATSGSSIHLDGPESTATPPAQVHEEREEQKVQAQEAGSSVPLPAQGVMATDRPAPVEPVRRSQRLLAKSRGDHT